MLVSLVAVKSNPGTTSASTFSAHKMIRSSPGKQLYGGHAGASSVLQFCSHETLSGVHDRLFAIQNDQQPMCPIVDVDVDVASLQG